MGGIKQSRNELPVDEGRRAFLDCITPDQNPYQENEWQHDEWQFGWDCEEQSNPDVFDWAKGKFKP
jgi:hypothetical protein